MFKRLVSALSKGFGKPMTVQQMAEQDDLWGTPTRSGMAITEKIAMESMVVQACVRVIAEDIGNMPAMVVRQDTDKLGRVVLQPLPNHPVSRLLARRPNDWMTPGEFKEFMIVWALLAGDSYAFVNRDSGGKPIELLPLMPWQCSVTQKANFDVAYRITDVEGGILGEFEPSEILHLKNLQFDRVKGFDAVKFTREAIALSLGLEEHQAMLHRNAGHPGSILYAKNGIKTEAAEKIKEGLKKLSRGDGRFGIAVLPGDFGYTKVAFSSADMQHFESRKFQVEEICRGFRMFPQMVGHTEKTATFASAESFFSAHRGYTLLSWRRRLSEAVDRVLLDEDNLRLQLNDSAFMLGSLKDIKEYYVGMVGAGILAPNEARTDLGRNPLPGLDAPLKPLNMATVGSQGENDDEESETPVDNADD